MPFFHKKRASCGPARPHDSPFAPANRKILLSGSAVSDVKEGFNTRPRYAPAEVELSAVSSAQLAPIAFPNVAMTYVESGRRNRTGVMPLPLRC